MCQRSRVVALDLGKRDASRSMSFPAHGPSRARRRKQVRTTRPDPGGPHLPQRGLTHRVLSEVLRYKPDRPTRWSKSSNPSLDQKSSREIGVPDLVVRPATPADRHRIWQLAQELATSFVPERLVFDASFDALLAAPNNLVLVADSPTQGVVGYVLTSHHVAFFTNGPVAWVEELIVDQPARNGGAGRALMSAVEDWARSLGAAYVSLATRRTAAFYTAIGYEESAAFFRKLL